MRAPTEIKDVLATIGFEAEDVSPDDDPAYTVFSRQNAQGNREYFTVCFAQEGRALGGCDFLDQITDFIGE